jgi:hypothetical protein
MKMNNEIAYNNTRNWYYPFFIFFVELSYLILPLRFIINANVMPLWDGWFVTAHFRLNENLMRNDNSTKFQLAQSIHVKA